MKDKTKSITRKKIISASSIKTDKSKDVSAFVQERFYSVNQNHNSAIIIGSSLALQSKDMEQDTILDSSGVLVTSNKLGIINGARVVVSDGLGGGVGNIKEDEEIQRVAQSTCEGFLDSEMGLDDTLTLMGGSTPPSKKPVKRRREEAQASLAAFNYYYDEKQGYTGEFANIGDGLMLILDKQYKLKHTICARHIYRGFSQWAPPSLQMLATTANKDNLVVRQSLVLKEGDIIVSMTDGIWSELPSNLISQTSENRDIGIEQESFEALLSSLNKTLHPSSFEIAKLITVQAMSQSLGRRKILLDIIHRLEQENFQEKAINTINEVITHFEKTGEDGIAGALKSILFEQGLIDGICYFKNVEIPLDIVMQDLKNRSVGDCSTINVNRVPYHLDELIRCFITNPEKHQALAPNFRAVIKSDEDLNEAFKRLSHEVKQSETDCKFSEVNFEPLFKNEVLNKAKKILICYFHIVSHSEAIVDYQKKLVDLIEYFSKEVSLEKDEMELLLSMVDSEIKPKKGLLQTFFNDNQSKLYKQFRKQVESGFSTKEDSKLQPGSGSAGQ